MEEIKNIEDLSNAEPLTIAKKLISILDEKDAKGIKLLHVEDQTILCDYFIICNGNSNTQIKSYAGELEYKMGLCGVDPRSIEGYAEATWVVMDYGSVIVHIFNRETRMFYNLEKLWSDSTEVDISDLVTEK
ncbi:MAG: ribosome silencing factor [Ruminococcaceae bacterium]|nr:ribosome silencing factor [Oscillospiraceae bacterium]